MATASIQVGPELVNLMLGKGMEAVWTQHLGSFQKYTVRQKALGLKFFLSSCHYLQRMGENTTPKGKLGPMKCGVCSF